MRRFFLALAVSAIWSLLPVTAAAAPPAAEAPAESHAELADALVVLLQDTVAVLEQCTDAQAAEAALPQLEKLRAEAERMMIRQAALPEPTIQDYMAAQGRANEFLDAKRALQTHIARLQQEGLMSAEIRRVLGIAPEMPSAGE